MARRDRAGPERILEDRARPKERRQAPTSDAEALLLASM